MRYSTHSQDANSIEYQRSANTSFCQKHGLEIVGEYADPGFSGGSADRPAFQQMLRDAQLSHEWSAVVVYNLSRFSREYDGYKYEYLLNDNGIDLLSTQESNGKTPIDIHNRILTYANNAYYRSTNALHTHSGMENRAKQGFHCGGIPPLGYKVGTDQRLEIDENEADIVREIFKMFDCGMSYTQMAKHLNDAGHLTKSGRPFTKHSFYGILTQQKYIGIFNWNKRQSKNSKGQRNNSAQKDPELQTIIEDGCPAIINKELFCKVQERLAEGQNGASSSKNRHPYLLSGRKLLYCAHCGSLMIGATKSSRGHKYTVYYCPTHKADISRCPTKDIPAKNLDKLVVASVVRNILLPADIPNLTSSLTAIGSEAKTLRRKLRGNQSSLNNLRMALERQYTDTVIDRIKQLEVERKNLNARLAACNTPRPDISTENLPKLQGKLYAHLLQKEDPNGYQLLKTVIERISVSNDSVEITLTA